MKTNNILKKITRKEFDEACEILWSEIEYQNNLSRRTDETDAKTPQEFATLGRVYLRTLEEEWAKKHNVNNECLDKLRILAATFLRAVIYCGSKERSKRRFKII